MSVTISMVVAVERHGGIGINNTLPWNIPDDLSHFKKVTMDDAILMGRKTYESLPKRLPGRLNVVLSTTMDVVSEKDFVVVRTLEEALVETERRGYHTLHVIGGAEVYQLCEPFITEAHVTHIKESYKTDTQLTGFEFDEWDLVTEVDRGTHVFSTYIR